MLKFNTSKSSRSFVAPFFGEDPEDPVIHKKQRTRMQPIRTASEIDVKIVIKPFTSMPLYQKMAQKISELCTLGMPVAVIAKTLHIARKTVRKARRYYTKP